MSQIGFDAQSLFIDGRRIWVTSGTIHYARLGHTQWRARLRSARQAGLNCITTSVPWHLHEPRANRFTFDDHLNLKQFVQTAVDEGLYVILRVGPFIGAGADGGGLPAWLSATPRIRMRQSHTAFLEACARFYMKAFEQVRGLQVTRPRNGDDNDAAGGILLTQIEQAWHCYHPEEAIAYLAELVHFLREAGCETPVIEANNCWQVVDGAYATWQGDTDLNMNLRQFRLVQKQALSQQFPRLVSAYPIATTRTLGEKPSTPADAQTHFYRLAKVLAAGGQFNIEPFAAGTMLGAQGGRTVSDAFIAHDSTPDAPLSATGAQGESYAAIKRIATFADQFSQVLAHLSPDDHAPVLHPREDGGDISVIAQSGAQGDVVFILRGEANRSKSAEVLLASGATLSVPLGKDRAAWVLQNANLQGVATLDHSNLRPWAFIAERMLVLYGPAGSEGIVSIDGAPLELKVPGGAKPLIVEHESLIIVVLNDEQVDAAYVQEQGLILGAAALNENDESLPHAKFKQVTRIDADGKATKLSPASPGKAGALPKLGAWTCAELDALLAGEEENFTVLKEPASLDKLSNGAACGWFRLSLPPVKGAGQVLAPAWRGRIRIFAKGKPVAMIGDVADAGAGPMKMPPGRDFVLLADSPGRLCEGWRLGEEQGPAGHLYSVKPVKLRKPVVSTAPAPDVSSHQAFLNDFAFGDHVVGSTWKWTVKPRSREGLIVRLKGLPFRAALLANDEPVLVYDPVQSGGCVTTLLETGTHITGGKNALVLAAFDVVNAKVDPRKAVEMFDITSNLTNKAEWAFAPWQAPGDETFTAMKTAPPTKQPRWYRNEFRLSEPSAPLLLDPRRLSKGHVFLNGKHVGGYWLTLGKGSADPQPLLLPDAWLKTDAPNVLTIFDEEGRSPKACKLAR